MPSVTNRTKEIKQLRKGYLNSNNFEDFELKDKINSDEEVFTITDLTRILKCSRYRVMQLYSIEGLPLQKVKNKYVINKVDLIKWMQEKAEEERRRLKMFFVYMVIFILLLIIIILLFFKKL